MAIAACCSLNLSPPSRSSPCLSKASNSNPSSTSRTAQVSRWGNHCALSLASSTLIIGLQMSDASAAVGERPVIAQDHQLVAVSSTYYKSTSAAKWSDKRMCPSWRTKSFEIVVPENLPRPSAHRRWENIGLSKQNAPALKVAVNTGCFSM